MGRSSTFLPQVFFEPTQIGQIGLPKSFELVALFYYRPSNTVSLLNLEI
jgi:hypothetical protein